MILLDFTLMESSLEPVLASAALGQSLLVAALLIIRAGERLVYVPLAGFFVSMFVIALQPVITALFPTLAAVSVVLLLPAYLSLGPLFWLYVYGLTKATPWQPEWSDLWHFLPALVAALLVTLSVFFPAGDLDSLVVEEDARPLFDSVDQSTLTFAGYTVIFIFALVLLWLVQSAYYLFSILRRLVRYRLVLKDLFASNERRELGWVIGVLITIGGIWLLAAVALLLENFADLTLFSGASRAAIVLLFIFLIGLWGLRQKPGFEGRYLTPEQVDEVQKYERSALDGEHSSRIVEKLSNAMLTDKLYLQPGLSLTMLADHTGVPANYISQTLNETLEQSFFDYVNGHRIEAAKLLLLESHDAVLDIAYAVGFNARSSFYTAFKQVAHTTPGQYRKDARRRLTSHGSS